MQRILQIAAVVLCLPSIAFANNGMTGETFGLGPAEPIEVAQVRYVSQETFGLGQTVVVYQDCPGGVCPLPPVRSTSITRQPILRPRTTIQRTVVETCPGGVCPLPQSSDRYSQPVVSQRSVSNCPTCPQAKYYSQPVNYTRRVSYSPQWTFPGDIDSHLMGAPHYVSAAELAGMTYDQKLQLHDSQHNSMRTGRSFGVLRERSRPLGWRFRPFLRMRMGW